MTAKLHDHLAYPPRAMKAELAEPNPQFIWGAADIGRAIGRNQRQTLHLLVSGQIKSARKVGAHWVANRDALLRELGAEA